ncbi:MAG: iron ABC transporter permease [Phycisphaerae bacterium]|nr:iron ABC transporter permease [Phycisphaerae bacterium]
MSRRSWLVIVALAVLAVAGIVARLCVGGEHWGLPESGQFWELRLLRAFSAAAVGVALGIAGVVVQSLLRNPLASPEVLGMSSGASLAVMLGIYLESRLGVSGSGAGSGLWSVGIAGRGAAALLGALAALWLVYALSQRNGVIEPASMVLVGVMVGIMCGAATMFVQHLMPDRGFATAQLLLGALSDDTSWATLSVIGIVVGCAGALACLLGDSMDAATLDDDEARSVGVRLSRLRACLFTLGGLLAACAVLLAGPVGFVGLVCPHAARVLLGRGGLSHRALVVASGCAGAALMTAADTMVKAADLSSGRMPIGVVTALVGGPAFLFILRRERAARTS